MTSRKQTQIAEREAGILKIAGKILAEEGAPALTMERVLAHVDFSKGTLYNHFSCREDLMVAFYAQCFAEHLPYFERGALFRGRPRERFVAAGLGDQIMHRVDPRPFSLALNEEILAAASRRWRDTFLDLHRDTMGIFTGIVRDGIASGDLAASVSPEMVAGAAWALSFGLHDVRASGLVFRGLPADEFERRADAMFAALLDGFGWRPLSSELDYGVIRQRALVEVFGPEARQLGLLPGSSET